MEVKNKKKHTTQRREIKKANETMKSQKQTKEN